jgi:hypothetical protein
MTIYDRAVDLQLKLEAAQSADTSVELLAKGQRLVDSLDIASNYFAGVAAFRAKTGFSGQPGVDGKAVSNAVSGFRAGLSRHGSAAFQHQPATTLTDVARAQRERVSRWVAARWKDLLSPHDHLVERGGSESLVGNRTHVVVAQARASKLRAVRTMDPVADGDALRAALGGDDVEAWLVNVGVLAAELRGALDALDTEHAALTPAVREALERAASADGLPLAEVSDELLEALRLAGAEGQLVVRRK